MGVGFTRDEVRNGALQRDAGVREDPNYYGQFSAQCFVYVKLLLRFMYLASRLGLVERSNAVARPAFRCEFIVRRASRKE
jgi:hypothetical protein